jgi:hypothetical protein
MSTPTERAAEAITAIHADDIGPYPYGEAREALTAAVSDREALARVLIKHTRRGTEGLCSCGHVVPFGASFAAHQADALAAYLTDGAA